MKIIWNRIESWLAGHAPEGLDGLNTPATPMQIVVAEATLGVSFPRDVRDTFLLHNGQAPDAPRFLDRWESMSVERIVEELKIWMGLREGRYLEGADSDTTGHTVTEWWSPRWIPLTSDGGGNHHCLDLGPGHGALIFR